MIIVAEYIGNDITGLDGYDGLFQVNEYGELCLYLQRLLDQEEMDSFSTGLSGKLIDGIRQDGCVLVMRFRYQESLFTDIANAMKTSVTDSILIGWQLEKPSKEQRFPFWGWMTIGAAVLIGIMELGKRKRHARVS